MYANKNTFTFKPVTAFLPRHDDATLFEESMESIMRWHVVPFINDRRVRDSLGYNLERCVQLKILPCKLVTDETFTDHLEHLYTLRADGKSVKVHYPDDQVWVTVQFYNDPDNELLRFVFLKLFMVVETRTSMTFKCVIYDRDSYKAHKMGEKRTYLMCPFEHSYIHASVYQNPFKVFIIEGDEFIKPSGGGTAVSIRQAAWKRHNECCNLFD